jgi:hypothetical protein
MLRLLLKSSLIALTFSMTSSASAQQESAFELKGVKPNMDLTSLAEILPSLKTASEGRSGQDSIKVLACGPATRSQNSCGDFTLAGFPIKNVMVTSHNERVCAALFIIKSDQENFNRVEWARIFATFVEVLTDKIGTKPAADPGNHSWASADKDLELWLNLPPPHKAGWTRFYIELLSNKCASQFNKTEKAIAEEAKSNQRKVRSRDL